MVGNAITGKKAQSVRLCSIVVLKRFAGNANANSRGLRSRSICLHKGMKASRVHCLNIFAISASQRKCRFIGMPVKTFLPPPHPPPHIYSTPQSKPFLKRVGFLILPRKLLMLLVGIRLSLTLAGTSAVDSRKKEGNRPLSASRGSSMQHRRVSPSRFLGKKSEQP